MLKIHPTYDAAFRQSAVDLLLSSGRSLKRVAADLGDVRELASYLA